VPPPIIASTETQALIALRAFLSGATSASRFQGYISGEVLTVTVLFSGQVYIGQTLTDACSSVVNGTVITASNGSPNTYLINIPQDVPEEIMWGVVEVVVGQDNRVPEPLGQDFIVITPWRRHRLAYVGTDYTDDILTAQQNGNILTVTAENIPPLVPGLALLDGVGVLSPCTTLGEQLTGAPDDLGTYFVSPSQDTPSVPVYAGTRNDTAPTQFTIQIDMHGPSSGDNAQAIATLFYSDYAYEMIIPFGVAPLYASEARQVPFLNAEQQIEYRWSIDADLQVDPTVRTTPQQFADKLSAKPVPVDLIEPL